MPLRRALLPAAALVAALLGPVAAVGPAHAVAVPAAAAAGHRQVVDGPHRWAEDQYSYPGDGRREFRWTAGIEDMGDGTVQAVAAIKWAKFHNFRGEWIRDGRAGMEGTYELTAPDGAVSTGNLPWNWSAQEAYLAGDGRVRFQEGTWRLSADVHFYYSEWGLLTQEPWEDGGTAHRDVDLTF
ncbi:hypothetical protein [Kitasatospora sp. NPDC004272]